MAMWLSGYNIKMTFYDKNLAEKNDVGKFLDDNLAACY